MNSLDKFKLQYEEIGSPTGFLMDNLKRRVNRKKK